MTTNWNSTNTNDRTPLIKRIFDQKWYDAKTNDLVLIYKTSSNEAITDVGYNGINVTDTISIDIRTMQSRDQLIKMRNEVRRIIYNNKSNITGYDYMKVIRKTDLCDKSIGLYREVIDVELRRLGEAI